MTDLEKLKSETDLFSLIARDTRLKKVAATAGGEWCGPCPFCGGKDRFRVQPEQKRWLCRSCTDGKWADVLEYVQRRDGVDFKGAIQALGGGAFSRPGRYVQPKPKPVTPAYSAPAAEWQAAAKQAISECENALWEPKYKSVLDYLRGRGLTDQTIKKFRLGYCATGARNSYGREISGLYVYRGIVIPCEVAGEVWYLKTRYMPGVPIQCHNRECKTILAGPGRCPNCGQDHKYIHSPGSRPAAIFNADTLSGADTALFCEGEFDCMIAEQALGAEIAVVSCGGSAGYLPDTATWGIYLLPLTVGLVGYDNDEAGQKGAKKILDLLGGAGHNTQIPQDQGKDITDFYQAGGDLWAWLKHNLDQYDPPQPWREWAAAAGGVVRPWGEALLERADQAERAGDLGEFARCFALGMIELEGDRQKWQDWALEEYQLQLSALDLQL